MPLTGVDRVRTLVGDMNKVAVQENVANGDGVTNVFQLDMFPVRTGTIEAFVSGAAVGSATGNIQLGTLDFSGTTVPNQGAQILCSYQYNALSDQEIQFAIDLASGASVLIAASFSCRQIAGNVSRLFAYTQGSKTINKNFQSKKLLDLAESLEMADKKAIEGAGTRLTVTTFDDSGTAFEGYDTAVAAQQLLTS